MKISSVQGQGHLAEFWLSLLLVVRPVVSKNHGECLGLSTKHLGTNCLKRLKYYFLAEAYDLFPKNQNLCAMLY